MFTCRISFGSLLGLLVLAFCGCSKTETKPALPSPPPSPSSSELRTVARVHWLGRERLDAEPNATNLVAIWKLPESANLAARVLDKLSLAPWGLQRGSATPTNPPSDLFRAVLEDILQAECFLEIRGGTNQPGELALALRLDAGRAAAWQTNLATVFESLTGRKPEVAANGWAFTQPHWPARIELTRAGDWTCFGLAAGSNGSLGAMTAQLPLFTPAKSAEWLEAEFDALGVSRALGLNWKLPADWPRLSLSLASRNGAVQTRAGLTFAQPLALELADWRFPTNLIHEPLIAFTAVRGLTKWLDSLPAWKELPLGSAPSQLFTWALNGIPLQTYLAIPDADASNRVEQLSAALIERSRSFFATNTFGKLERTNGVLNWVDFPFLPPSLEAMSLPAGEFIVAGFSPGARTNRHNPDALMAQFLTRTNLVYYDWEITEPRVEAWIYLGQTLRLVTRHAQLPPQGQAQNWLNALAPKLGNSVTAGALTAPNQLTFTRTSSFGFTALELQLLADWLASPDFPHGLHSFNAEPDPRLYQVRPRPAGGAAPAPDSPTPPPAPR